MSLLFILDLAVLWIVTIGHILFILIFKLLEPLPLKSDVSLNRMGLGWSGTYHSAGLLLLNQSSFPSRPVHEHALILQPGLLCPHIGRICFTPTASMAQKSRSEMDQTSLIWATFLRSGHRHCGTGRPASQRVASNHLKLPETA